MAAPELLHSAPEIPRQLGELSQLFSPDSLHHLATTLRSLGHPYGILLSQQPNSSKRSAESSVQNDPLLPSSKISAELGEYILYSSEHLGEAISHSSKDPNWSKGQSEEMVLASFWINSSSSSLPASVVASSLGLYALILGSVADELDNKSAGRTVDIVPYSLSSSPVASSLLSFLSSISAPIYEQGKQAKAHAKNIPLGLAVPLISASVIQETFPRPQELYIAHHNLILGSTSLKLSTYRGEQPFTIKTPDGQPVAEIQPGDPLAALHVSHQAARFRRLSPLEKAHAMVADVTQLLSAIDQTDPSTLSPDQQTTLAKAKDATIIGISHLVRLFRRQTGLPTWKLDVLPPLLQRFHALDSQAVSTQFGGKRKVRPQDIEMLVITPTQRRQLLANLQP